MIRICLQFAVLVFSPSISSGILHHSLVPLLQSLLAIFSTIILILRVIRRWERERERVHRSWGGRRSWPRASATRTGARPSYARGRFALPEGPHATLVCCALPDPNGSGLVAVGIGTGEQGRVWCVVVSWLSMT